MRGLPARGLSMKVQIDTKQKGPLAGLGEGPIGTPQPAWEAGTAESGWSKVSPTTRVLSLRTRYCASRLQHAEFSIPQ
jgi:hypothetical protein